MAAIIFVKSFPAILVLLGLLPSALWLIFYLREDCHPEPKRLVLRVFAWGMLIAPLAVIIQYLFLQLWNAYAESALRGFLEGLLSSGARGIDPATILTLGSLVVLAAIEEYLKYLVVKTEVEGEPDFDEPVDAVEYLIIAALGFAAVENILIAFSLAPTGGAAPTESAVAGFTEASQVLGIRFFGATLLHAFSSAIIGYFLAVSLFQQKRFAIAKGLIFATALHAAFNYLILVRSEVAALTLLAAASAMIAVIVWVLRRAKRLTKSHSLHPF